MGLDLILLPIEFEGNFWFSQSLLRLERRTDLFEKILDLESEFGCKIPVDFRTYTSRDDEYKEPHYGSTAETPYGEPIKFITARDLLKLETHEGVLDDYQNRAVWAYLKELPEYMKIALYWN